MSNPEAAISTQQEDEEIMAFKPKPMSLVASAEFKLLTFVL